jgi:hypothetical protein
MNGTPPSKRGVKFILAEDIRNEGSGKFSLLGVFPGERLGVLGTPAPGTPPGVAVALPSLAFVFIVTEGKGKTTGTFKVTGSDRNVVGSEMPLQPVELRDNQPSVIGATAKPFLAPSFGTYTVELTLGKAKFRFRFTIEKGKDPKSK